MSAAPSGSPYLERITPGGPEWRQEIVTHAQRYRFAARFVRGKRVLDAGCGTGYGSRIVAEAGASQVVAVDLSEGALGIARKQFAHPNIQFVCDDCEVLGRVEGSFEVVLSLESLEHFQHVERFLDSVADRLAPAGTFICSTPNGDPSKPTPENPHHVHEYSSQELLELMKRYFTDVSLYGQHWTATFRAVSLLWSNPFIRVGRWLQGLRGRRLPSPYVLPPTEGDIIISDLNADTAWTLLAVCRGPLKDGAK